jgi:hypothetical protein
MYSRERGRLYPSPDSILTAVLLARLPEPKRKSCITKQPGKEGARLRLSDLPQPIQPPGIQEDHLQSSGRLESAW